jgi:hypothetical protein
MYSSESKQMIWRNISPPSSESKVSKEIKKNLHEAGSKQSGVLRSGSKQAMRDFEANKSGCFDSP